jgi:hypothetical protein
VLEKIKRKIATDPQYHANSQETVTRLNEVYSRFVKFKNLDKKTYDVCLRVVQVKYLTVPVRFLDLVGRRCCCCTG